ncbi:hypothetical protein A2U01_0110427, partial [Trifolium medium]|nr:hypothetical protein [Trifolium medium]
MRSCAIPHRVTGGPCKVESGNRF